MTDAVPRPAALDTTRWASPFSLATLRGARWARRAIRRARRELPVTGLETQVEAPPELPVAATRGVQVVLHRAPATCLERALVLQRWLDAHGERHDVLIGVDRDANGAFTAHAWLDYESGTRRAGTYREIHRRAP